MPAPAKVHFWAKTRRLTCGLLGLWVLVNFAVPWFARQLDSVRGFGFSAGYWLAAEGALLMYLAIIVGYVWRMEGLEARLLAQEEKDGQAPTSPGPV
jgi:putative solute:sodium symporter small subunit